MTDAVATGEGEKVAVAAAADADDQPVESPTPENNSQKGNEPLSDKKAKELRLFTEQTLDGKNFSGDEYNVRSLTRSMIESGQLANELDIQTFVTNLDALFAEADEKIKSLADSESFQGKLPSRMNVLLDGPTDPYLRAYLQKNKQEIQEAQSRQQRAAGEQDTVEATREVSEVEIISQARAKIEAEKIRQTAEKTLGEVVLRKLKAARAEDPENPESKLTDDQIKESPEFAEELQREIAQFYAELQSGDPATVESALARVDMDSYDGNGGFFPAQKTSPTRFESMATFALAFTQEQIKNGIEDSDFVKILSNFFSPSVGADYGRMHRGPEKNKSGEKELSKRALQYEMADVTRGFFDSNAARAYGMLFNVLERKFLSLGINVDTSAFGRGDETEVSPEAVKKRAEVLLNAMTRNEDGMAEKINGAFRTIDSSPGGDGRFSNIAREFGTQGAVGQEIASFFREIANADLARLQFVLTNH
jgi:hypothetical protein